MAEYERAKRALEDLAAESDQTLDLNEATTRLRLIDRILNDCLGWSPEEITAEPYQEGDYLDYVLGSPKRQAVLEAKRTGHHFEVPAGVANERVVEIKTIYEYSAFNRSAIDQVLRYCQRGGIPVAILCNGTQLLTFLGSRQDGIAPLSGKCLQFSGFNEMKDGFAQLWDCLSKDGLRTGKLRQLLSHRSGSTPPPERLSSRIAGYPGFRTRSELETDVRILADLFLQDLVQEEEVSDEFLAECYCSSGALSQYALVSKEILRTRYASLRGSVGSTENVNPRKGKPARLTSDLISSALVRRPLILLGDVGVGKTIFLKHFFRIEATDVLSSTIVFYVDFLKQSSLLEDVRSYLVDTIETILAEKHGVDIHESDFVRATYNKEINRFKRGIYAPLRTTDPTEYSKQEVLMLAEQVGNRLEHLRRSLEQLRGTRNLQFVLVLDNLDHHESAFQEQVFVIGQSLAETWPVAVFMSLRPDTFYNSRKTGSIAAYQPRVFTVEPPRTDLVILKRLEFARRQLEESGRLESFPQGLTIDSERLMVYLDVLTEAFRSNTKLKELVDNLSSGNVRQALGFISNFVGSGYVSTARILQVHERGELYILPLHEFIRAMLYQEYDHYDPRASDVANLFDITTNDAREHFALPILLAACESRGESQQDGYVEESLLYAHMQELGYSLEQITCQVDRAIERKLLQVSNPNSTFKSMRITAAGAYMHKRMITMFSYVDAMIVDTPITDPSVRHEIRNVITIHDRLERAQIFQRYLDQKWAFGDDRTTFSWPVTSAELQRDIEAATQRADRRRNISWP
jgi:hypothetical protein